MDILMPLLARQGGPPSSSGPGAGPPMGLPPPAPLNGNPVVAVLLITIIMTIIVSAKVFTKLVLLKQAGWDDIWVVIGAGFVIALTGVIVSVFHDAGLTGGSASPAAIGAPALANRLFVYLLLGAVPNGFAKLSILFLYLQLFPRTARPMAAYCIYFGIAVVTLYYSILVIYTGVHCGPYRGTCSVPTQVKIAQASASINLVLDVYVMSIAVVNIWTLKMNTRYKIGVIMIFLTGVLALVCSIITLYYRVTTTEDPNAVWTQVLVPLVLVIYEPSIALITASLPATPSLWRRVINTSAMLSARHLLSRLTGTRSSFGSVELAERTSAERSLQHPYSNGSKNTSKKSQEVYSVDLESLPTQRNGL